MQTKLAKLRPLFSWNIAEISPSFRIAFWWKFANILLTQTKFRQHFVKVHDWSPISHSIEYTVYRLRLLNAIWGFRTAERLGFPWDLTLRSSNLHMYTFGHFRTVQSQNKVYCQSQDKVYCHIWYVIGMIDGNLGNRRFDLKSRKSKKLVVICMFSFFFMSVNFFQNAKIAKFSCRTHKN